MLANGPLDVDFPHLSDECRDIDNQPKTRLQCEDPQPRQPTSPAEGLTCQPARLAAPAAAVSGGQEPGKLNSRGATAAISWAYRQCLPQVSFGHPRRSVPRRWPERVPRKLHRARHHEVAGHALVRLHDETSPPIHLVEFPIPVRRQILMEPQ